MPVIEGCIGLFVGVECFRWGGPIPNVAKSVKIANRYWRLYGRELSRSGFRTLESVCKREFINPGI